ncbi:N-acetylmuramic acid 6-phosphate etherase [Gryllotalpicola sp.]|uniref:N-acetylmuramic acid 6-phosphate etherase n=1 Tax=Gryllotalpicola sp. TaxID=1932787 RepID=UPI002639662E|nr:N-acetylmuramic acid 6-phosphate etherase [Gryllotalpicola sp.]
MTTNPPNTDLDDLVTEAVADDSLMLDELGVAELVTLMNDRDATIPVAVREALPVIATAIEATIDRMRRGGRLIYAGAGTSGRLGVLDASEIPPTFGADPGVVIGLIAGGPAALVSSVEAAEDSDDAGAADVDGLNPTPLDVVLGIASSGRTPYVIGALRRAGELGALTVGLSCNLNTPVSAAADFGIEIPVGPEIVTGSTRLAAGTATKMVLNMFSTVSMIKLGKSYRTLMVDVKATNAKLVRRAIRIVVMATGADEETAREALDRTDWHAKEAIAMIATGMDAEEVRAALEAAGGFLGKIVGR